LNNLNNDNELIAALNSGEEKAITEVFGQYYQALCYFATRLIQRKEEAEDIVIGVFSKCWNSKKDFDSVIKLKGFLFVTTRNACYDYLRQMKRVNNQQEELLYILSNEEEENFEAEKTRAEVLKKIYEEIEKLPTQCKKVLELSIFEGLKSKEIAEQLDISVSNVTSQKSRAVQLIKTALLKQKLVSWLWFWF